MSKYIIYVNSQTQQSLEDFKKLIEEQNFFSENDEILYVPSDHTYVEVVPTTSVDKVKEFLSESLDSFKK